MDEFTHYLQEQMDLKRSCTIRFRDVQGAVTTVTARIVKMDEVAGRYMIETDAGLVIGLDQIETLNGRPRENYC